MNAINYILGVCMIALALPVSAESIWDKETEILDKPVEVVVYRSPTCGCCKKWIRHLQHHQFKIKDIVTSNMADIKEKYKVPKEMGSCHTALVDGYIVEGHVPAGDIKSMLKMRPKIIGISVPGMPGGTPGMEMGDRKDPFKVISFDENGNFEMFNQYK